MTEADRLRWSAALVEYGHPINHPGLIGLDQVFGREFVGRFDHPTRTPEGRHERIVALCMAAAVMEQGEAT